MKDYKMNKEIKKLYDKLDPEMKDSVNTLIREMISEKSKKIQSDSLNEIEEVKHFADGFHEGNWQDD